MCLSVLKLPEATENRRVNLSEALTSQTSHNVMLIIPRKEISSRNKMCATHQHGMKIKSFWQRVSFWSSAEPGNGGCHFRWLTSLRSLEDSLVNHWLYSRAAMMGIRSLEAKLIKNMSMVLQYSSSDTASLGRSSGAYMPVILPLLEEGSQNIRSSRSALYIDNSRQSRTCEAMSQRAKQRKLRHYILFRYMFGGAHVPKIMCVGQRSPMLKSRLFISTLLRWSLLSLCCVIQTSWPESFQAILLSLGICLPSHCEVLRLQMNAITSAFPMGSRNWAGIARFVQQALSPTEL